MSEQELTVPGDDAPVPGPLPLTPKEEAFCVAFGDPESVTYGRSEKSAAAAGYVQPRSAGWKLRRRPRIIARLGEFQAAAKAVAAKVLTDLENTRLLALEKGDLAVAARCSELQGKHIGMFYERNVLTLDSPGVYDPVLAIEARRITRFLLMNPVDPALLPEAPLLPAAAEPVPAAQPTRASAADLAALDQNPQSPQERQGE
jgi:hypothetical protein